MKIVAIKSKCFNKLSSYLYMPHVSIYEFRDAYTTDNHLHIYIDDINFTFTVVINATFIG
jgi:hypothetical protein